MSSLRKTIERACSARPVAIKDIAKALATATRTASDDDFDLVIQYAKDDDYEGFLSAPAMAALPAWGERGVEALLDLAFNSWYKLKTNTRALEVLLSISRNISICSKRVMYLDEVWDREATYMLNEKTVQASLYGLREKLLLAFRDEWDRGRFLFTLGQMGMLSGIEGGPEKEDLDYLLSLVVDNHLLINPSILDEFSTLIDSGPAYEEKLQVFLTNNPILLDPFVSVLYTKQELGSDFITDYIIKRMNNHYVLVEIENSTDRLFNQNGTFSSHLTTAISQVRDFQAWVSDNLSYAQKKLPGIKYPGGLVVIGRSEDLSDIEKKRLVEENHSRRGHIIILTYDDLLETSKNVYKNFIERPMVVKTRDTRSI